MRNLEAKQNCLNNCNTFIEPSPFNLKESLPFIKPSKSKILIPPLNVQSTHRHQQGFHRKQSKQESYELLLQSQTREKSKQFSQFQSHQYQEVSEQVINSWNQHKQFANLSIPNNNRSKQWIKQNQLSHCQYPQLLVSKKNCQLAIQHKQNIKKDIQKVIKSIRRSQSQVQSVLMQECKKIRPICQAKKRSTSNSSQNMTKGSIPTNTSNAVSSQDLYCSLQRLRKIDKLQKIINKVIEGSDDYQNEQEQMDQVCQVQNTFVQEEYAQQLLKQIVEGLEYNIRVKNQYINKLETKVQSMTQTIRQYLQKQQANSEQKQMLQKYIDQTPQNSPLLLENSMQFAPVNFKEANILDRSKWDQVQSLFNQPTKAVENRNCQLKDSDAEHSFGKKSLHGKFVNQGIQSFPILTDRNFLTDRIIQIEQQKKLQQKRQKLRHQKAFQIFMINQVQTKVDISCQKIRQESICCKDNPSQAQKSFLETRVKEVQTQVNFQQNNAKQINQLDNLITKKQQILENTCFTFLKKYKLLVKMTMCIIRENASQTQTKIKTKNFKNYLKNFANQFNEKYYALKKSIKKGQSNIEILSQNFLNEFNGKLEECSHLHDLQLHDCNM